MNMPMWLKGDSLTRLLQGVAVGAIATIVVGFNWGGWVLGGTAKSMAESTSRTAVVAALAPICVEQFQANKNAAANLEELKKTSSWQQASFVEKGGWAIMPGSKVIDSGVPQGCAALLTKLQ